MKKILMMLLALVVMVQPLQAKYAPDVLHLRLLFARDYAFSMARKERPQYAGVVIADKIVELLTETWDLYGLEWLAVDRAGLPLYYSGIDEDLRKVAREQMRREQALRIEGDFYIN